MRKKFNKEVDSIDELIEAIKSLEYVGALYNIYAFGGNRWLIEERETE